MSFKQAIPFNPNQAGSIPNLCLDNVRRGYGIANKYVSAWDAWQHTQQHADRNMPDGLAVPLYYSYTANIDGVTQNYGHINVRLPDGRVWSDGNFYASIDAYTAYHYPKFVGWGESINDFKILEESEDDMAEIFNGGDAQNVTNQVLGGGSVPEWISKYVDGHTTYKEAREAIDGEVEMQKLLFVNNGDIDNIANMTGWPREGGLLHWNWKHVVEGYYSPKVQLEHKAVAEKAPGDVVQPKPTVLGPGLYQFKS